METSALREKLHSLIDSSPEEKLIEVYSMFEEEYTDEFKANLNEEYADYQQNGEVISREEMNEAIEQELSENKYSQKKMAAYKGILTKEEGEQLKQYVKQSREEWDNNI